MLGDEQDIIDNVVAPFMGPNVGLINQATTKKGLRFCFDFESEGKAPYGDGAKMCLQEDGAVVIEYFADISAANYVRNMQNIGMAIAAYFSEPSDFAVAAVEDAKGMAVPEESVPKQDSIEELGFIDRVIQSNLERSENCRELPLGCNLWE